MLVRGQMPKRVEGGDRVGTARTQVEPGHVGLDQSHGRRSLSGQPQLCDGGVEGQDAMFRRQQPRRRFARAAAKFDDEASGCQSAEQPPNEVQASRRHRRPLPVPDSDAVVARPHDVESLTHRSDGCAGSRQPSILTLPWSSSGFRREAQHRQS